MIYTIKLDTESCIKTTSTPDSFPPVAAVKLVSFAAVIRVVTRHATLWGGALRDV